MNKLLIVWFGALTCVGVACGGSDGGGAAGSSGTSAAGASSSGAAGTGGAGASGAPAGQCSPGDTYKFDDQFNQKLTQCLGYTSTSPGFPSDPGVTVQQLELPGGLVAGKAFALSADVNVGGPLDFEVWGSTGFCGEAEELLYKAPAVSGPVCITLIPKAAHGNVLTVMAGSADTDFVFRSFTVCPNGSCPK